MVEETCDIREQMEEEEEEEEVSPEFQIPGLPSTLPSADILAGSYKGDVDSSLIQRLQDLDDAKKAELSMLQAAQKRDDDRREADAYATQTGAGSGYKGGENTRAARTTGNYDDPFAPGDAD